MFENSPLPAQRVLCTTLAIASAACAPTLKMSPGTPIEIRRGYCFANTEYIQSRRARSPSDTLDQLAKYKESAPHVRRGEWLKVGGYVSSVGGISLATAGVLGRTGGIEMDENTATILLTSGIALEAVSIGLCIAGEGQFESAVEVYNEKVVPTGGAQDFDDADPSADGADGTSDGNPTSRTGRPSAPVER